MTAENAPIGAPSTEDSRRWQKEADELRHTGLAAVRGVAEKWEASIGTLLGAFTLVAFVKGHETFADIDAWARNLAGGLVLLAVLLAMIAIVCAALAAQGTPKSFANLTGRRLQDWYQKQGGRAVELLWASRVCAVAAAVVVLAAVAITWYAHVEAPPAKGGPQAVVTFAGGSVSCGELKVAGESGLALSVSGVGATPTLLSLKDVASVTLVDICPTSP